MKPMRILCAREIQKSIKDSVKQLLDDQIQGMNLRHLFRSIETEIQGPHGSQFMFAGLKTNPDSIKSMEGLDAAWVEEANRVSARSIELLVPTLRKPTSEIWYSWNPESEFDAVDMRFRGKMTPPGSFVRRVSWRDNPWFPDVLRREMDYQRETDPQAYAHVWEGEYRAAPKGSYYGASIVRAQAEGRIAHVEYDDAAPVHVSFDLGNGPNMALWFAQFIGQEIHVIDYLQGDDEAAQEGLNWFVREMRGKGYEYGTMFLPHDSRAREKGSGRTFEEMMIEHGFSTQVVPMVSVEDGIEAVRRILPRVHFDAGNCAEGLKSLREYRLDWDEKNRIARGPLKNWTAHASDSFRYLALAYEEPAVMQPRRPQYGRPQSTGAWMS